MSAGCTDEQLGALIDGELAPADVAPLLERLRVDPGLRDRMAQIRLTKDLVRHAYAAVEPPPAARRPRLAGRWGRHAAAAAVFAVGLLIGWLGRDGLPPQVGLPLAAADAPGPQAASGHVIVHVGSDAPEAGLAAIARVQGLIEAARDSGQRVAIEIVANGAGLDLLRVATSPHALELQALRQAHPAVALIACGQTVRKLQAEGADVRLLPGTLTATSALDQIVLRMQQGWAYVRI